MWSSYCRYSLKTGTRIIGGRDVELSAPLNEIPVHVRGGNILPRQGHGLTTNAACADHGAYITNCFP